MNADQKVSWIAVAGSFVSAGLIASCCLGPAIFLVFGATIGALGSLGVLEPYRPYFMAAGFGFWGYGFFRLYLRPVASTGVECGTACERPSRAARSILWVGLGVLLFAVALPRLALYWAG
jgi:hypothetical protein